MAGHGGGMADAAPDSQASWRRVATNEAMGGFCAGVVGTVIGYPLDTIKTRMQTSHHRSPSSSTSSSSSSSTSTSATSTSTSSSSASSSRPPGIVRVARDLVRTEGLTAMYRGVMPPLISLTLLNTINFTSYGRFRSMLGAQHRWDVRNGIAGALGGPIAASISTVEHVLKTQMQLDNVGAKRYRGSFHAMRCLVQEHGVRSLYLGHVVNTAREALFLFTYFYAYEGLRHTFVDSMGGASMLAVPIAGGMSGALGWFISFPLDCIKAGVQGQRLDQVRIQDIDQLKIAKQLLAHPTRLYSGLTASVVRAFLVSGSRFSAYEFALWTLGKYRARARPDAHDTL